VKLSELIRKKEVATATVATLATVTAKTPPSVATVASVAVANTKADLETATPIKPLSLQDRQQETRRQKVLAMLEAAAPETLRVIYVDTDTDRVNVIVAVAIRHLATFEMTIPKANYDAWKMLELLERMDTDTPN
jgi:hypothetical protein